jgi:hypothetical protein
MSCLCRRKNGNADPILPFKLRTGGCTAHSVPGWSAVCSTRCGPTSMELRPFCAFELQKNRSRKQSKIWCVAIEWLAQSLKTGEQRGPTVCVYSCCRHNSLRQPDLCHRVTYTASVTGLASAPIRSPRSPLRCPSAGGAGRLRGIGVATLTVPQIPASPTPKLLTVCTQDFFQDHIRSQATAD